MLNFDCRNVSKDIIGETHGLDLNAAFNDYQEKIRHIIADLNTRKDKPGQWLQWMNLGYNEETVWYVVKLF